MVETTCINSKDKPFEIPLQNWIQEGFKYNITHVYFHPVQGISGVDLKEVKLDESCYPYETFKLSRFAITQEGLLQLIEMIKDCSELNSFQIDKLIEESKLEILKNE